MVAVSSVYILTVIMAIMSGMFGGPNSDDCRTSAILSFPNELPDGLCIMFASLSWVADRFYNRQISKDLRESHCDCFSFPVNSQGLFLCMHLSPPHILEVECARYT